MSQPIRLSVRARLLPASIISLVLVLSVLTACSSPTPTPMPTVVPSKTARPTFTPQPSDTPVPTATVVPTSTPIPPTPTPTATPTVDGAISPLTGRRVSDPALLNRRVLAVRIGNDPEIRPQEGLGQADIVYEEIMEGWTITRFTALYLDHNVTRLRPLRSARLSSLAIVPQYDAASVHTGASDRIRYLISKAPIVDLDQFFNEKPYGVLDGYDWRGRMYTSVENIHAYLRERNLERDTPIKGYTFDPTPPATAQPAVAIHIPYPPLAVVDWGYDKASGRYLRSVQGVPHLEGLTKEQIAADNVIIFYAEHRLTDIVEDVNGAASIDIVMTGSGRAQVCRDGVVVEGRWSHDNPKDLIQYYDASGKLIPLRPGQTWIELVPADYKVPLN
jgi:hypothetical protein